MTAAPSVETPRTGPGDRAQRYENPGGARPGHRALAGHLRRQRGRLTVGVALGLMGSVMGLAQPLAAKRVMDGMGRGQPETGPVLVLCLLVVSGALLVGLGHYVLQWAAESMVYAARRFY